MLHQKGLILEVEADLRRTSAPLVDRHGVVVVAAATDMALVVLRYGEELAVLDQLEMFPAVVVLVLLRIHLQVLVVQLL
jgi:hypothetical protein